MPKDKIVPCRSCKAPIFFVLTPRNKNHPVDAKPVRVWVEGDGIEQLGSDMKPIRDLTKWEQVEGYTSHFDTCPEGDRFRGKRNRRKDPSSFQCPTCKANPCQCENKGNR